MKRPTITDLAAAANVSISTVDRVLNGRDPVRQATTSAVLEAAERIGFYGIGTIRSRLSQRRKSGTFGYLLQQPDREIYRLLARCLAESTSAHQGLDARPVIRFLNDLSPEHVAAELRQLASKCDAVALVSADQPQVNDAIEEVSAGGVPVFALMSDVTTQARAGYVGTDNWKLGRTAAWFVNQCSSPEGAVAILMGNFRYQNQETAEASFRSYLREASSNRKVLETIMTMEERGIAYNATLQLLDEHPDLAAIFIAGGGVSGAMQALRENRHRERRPFVIVRGISDETRQGLLDGTISTVLAHPMEQIAASLVDAMASALDPELPGHSQYIVPFQIFTSQNI